MSRVETSSGEDGKFTNNELIYELHTLAKCTINLVKSGLYKVDSSKTIKNIFLIRITC